MPHEDMIEMHLDVTSVDPYDGERLTQRVTTPRVAITTLAEERSRDPEALANLYALALVVHRSPQWTLEEYLERFDRWEAVFIAKHGSTYVGYTYLTERECAAGALNQCMTGVRPEYRRCGIGTALKARGIRYAQEQGFRTILTRIRADNEASIAMNQKMGFREGNLCSRSCSGFCVCHNGIRVGREG